MSGYQGANPLNPYASASPWGAYGGNALTPWASPWGGYGSGMGYAGGDMGLTDISNWLPYQTYAQFMPQQWQQQFNAPQQQLSQPQSQQSSQGQPQPMSPDMQAQQMQALMQIAGVGRPNLGGGGTG